MRDLIYGVIEMIAQKLVGVPSPLLCLLAILAVEIAVLVVIIARAFPFVTLGVGSFLVLCYGIDLDYRRWQRGGK